jgi:hypothetical protein
LTDHYTIYDFDNNRLGFVGSHVDNLPTKSTGLAAWAVVLIVIAVLAVVVAVGVFIFIKLRNKKL